MHYTPSPFQPGDIVETTEEYKNLRIEYSKHHGYYVNTWTKGIVKKVYVLHHKDTGLPMVDYILLENNEGSISKYFKKVI